MRTNRGVQVGGAWLAVASCLMILTLVLHGPIAPDLNDQMAMIANASMQWAVAHWFAAAGLSLFAVAALLILTSGSRLTEAKSTSTAWAVVPVAALWTLTTAVAEATVVTNAAVSGDAELFHAWWAFAEGKANGFAFLALAVAVIAWNDAQNTKGMTPTWSAWTAVVVAVASFTGWVVGMWFGIGLGNLVWFASSVLMSVWIAWFGVALTRAPVSAMSVAAVDPSACT
jgi:hypothetical protein